MQIIDMTSPNIRLIKNFLSQEEIDKVLEVRHWEESVWDIDFIMNYPKQHQVDPTLWWSVMQWKGMCINFTYDTFYSRYDLDKQFYLDLAKRIEPHVKERFEAKNIRTEQYLINRWRPGREQQPHLDYFIEQEGEHDYEMLEKYHLPKSYLDTFESRFQTKHYSSLIYLNDDYVGGELYFPQHENLTLRMEPGDLVVFRGDENTLHGVKKIESGIRYTISLFWADTDKEKAYGNN